MAFDCGLNASSAGQPVTLDLTKSTRTDPGALARDDGLTTLMAAADHLEQIHQIKRGDASARTPQALADRLGEVYDAQGIPTDAGDRLVAAQRALGQASLNLDKALPAVVPSPPAPVRVPRQAAKPVRDQREDDRKAGNALGHAARLGGSALVMSLFGGMILSSGAGSVDTSTIQTTTTSMVHTLGSLTLWFAGGLGAIALIQLSVGLYYSLR